MTTLTVPLSVEPCALDSRLGRPLSASAHIIVHLSPPTSEITIKTPDASFDVSSFQDSAGTDRRKNSIQTP